MVPGMDLGESSQEGDSIWLAYCSSLADIGPKNTHAGMGALFISKWVLVMMFAVTSHCTCHLPEVWPDTFLRHILDNACWHQQLCHRPIIANYGFTGLGNGHTGKYCCKKVSHTVRVQFHCDICLTHQNFINKCCCIMCYTV